MQRLVTGMYSDNRGFTLVEILVVLVIVGITLSFALLAFGDFGQSRRMMMAADQFTNMVGLAQQQAILESSTLGISLKNNSYQIVRFVPPNDWRPIADKGIFAVQHFPDKAVIDLNIKSSAKKNTPEIIINSTGDMTAFQLKLGTHQQPNIKTLTWRHDGLLVVQ